MINPKKIGVSPSSRRLVYLRTQTGPRQDLGHLYMFDGPMQIYHAVTVGKAGIISDGLFSMFRKTSPKSGKEVLEFRGMPGHSNVQFHILNTVNESLGCVGPGSDFKDINADGLLDVVGSKAKMDELLALVPDEVLCLVKTIEA